MTLKQLFTETKNPYSKANIDKLTKWLLDDYGIKFKIEKLKSTINGTMNVATKELTITPELEWAKFIHVLLHEIGHSRMVMLNDMNQFLITATGLNPNARIGEKTQEREVSLFAIGIILYAAREFSSDTKINESIYKVFQKAARSSTQYNGSNKYQTEFKEGYELKIVLDTQKRTRTENVRSILVINNILEFIKEVK